MFFEKQVDARSRQAMVNFLTGHFRYPIDNSWARTSYANRVKIPYLGLTRASEALAVQIRQTTQTVLDRFRKALVGVVFYGWHPL
jgi:hypothetical protein